MFESSRVRFAAVVALLSLQAALLAYSAAVHSPTFDEVGHLAAGIEHWRTGKFDLYRVNPPLVRLAAALPVLWTDVNLDYPRVETYLDARDEFTLGRNLIQANGERAFRLFTLARWACLPFGLVLSLVCYRWAGELYGPNAGIAALALCCISPMLLGHGSLITPDVPAAALGIVGFYLFRRWLRSPHALDMWIAGIALGLMQLTKFTWIIAFGIWPILWTGKRYFDRREGNSRQLLSEAAQLGAMFAIALAVINVGYGFEGAFRRLDDIRFISRALSGHNWQSPVLHGGNRFRHSQLGRLRMPLPENYLRGIDVQRREFERPQWSYLRGQWRNRGWWWYYVYALAIKEPLGIVALVCAASLFATLRFGRLGVDEAILLAPGIAILVLVSSQTGFNHHARYVLPTLPFAFVFTSQLASNNTRNPLKSSHPRGRWPMALTAVCIGVAGANSLSVFPHSLSYFNLLAGGPENGHAHLVDSNIDWGQDLLHLQKWLVKHPDVTLEGFAYPLDHLVSGSLIGVTAPPPPIIMRADRIEIAPSSEEQSSAVPRPGWYAISVDRIRARDGNHRYFLLLEPEARVGYSINVYQITEEEAAQLRRNALRADPLRTRHMSKIRKNPSRGSSATGCSL